MRIGRLLGFAVLGSALTASPALADLAFVVTTTLDMADPVLDGRCGFAGPPRPDGTEPPRICSLRAAIQESNHTSEQVRILLPHGRYQLSILGSGEDFDSATGDLDIWGDVSITGDGAGTLEAACPWAVHVEWLAGPPGCWPTPEETSTTIDSMTRDRIFDVHGGGRLQLYGVGLTGGLILRPRTAPPPFPTEGGAIRNDGTLIVSNVAMYQNIADNGGAVFNTGAAEFRFTSMHDNSAQLQASGCGGAIMNRGLMRIYNSLFQWNRAGGDGGAICNHSMYTRNYPIRSYDDVFDNSMELTDVAIDSNSSRHGGGIASNSSLVLAAAAVRSNTATDGGGVLIERGDAQDRRSYVFHVLVETNVAVRDGGGLWLGENLVVREARIELNHAGLNGAGVFVSGPAHVQMAQTGINRNDTSFRGSGGGLGGALRTDGYIELLNTTLSGNEAGIGGGISVAGAAGSRLLLRSVTLAQNTARRGAHVLTAGVALFLKNTLSTLGASGTRPELDTDPDCVIVGPISEAGRNLSDDRRCVPSAAEFMPGPFVHPDLAWNGGFTPTHALSRGSAAIDAVAFADCDNDLSYPYVTDLWDQRWVTRPRGAACDIGAFEAAAIEIGGPLQAPVPALMEMASAASTMVFSIVDLQQWLLSLSQGAPTPADEIVQLARHLAEHADEASIAADDQSLKEALMNVETSLNALDKAMPALRACCGAFQKGFRFQMVELALARFHVALGQLQKPPTPIEK